MAVDALFKKDFEDWLINDSITGPSASATLVEILKFFRLASVTAGNYKKSGSPRQVEAKFKGYRRKIGTMACGNFGLWSLGY